MNFAKASIDVPLSMPNTYVAWTDFEGFHRFLHVPTPGLEQFDEACLRVAAGLGGGPRCWSRAEVMTTRGRQHQWHGKCQGPGTSLLILEAMDADVTRVHVAIPETLTGQAKASAQALRRVADRLEGDLRHFRHLIRQEQERLAAEDASSAA